MQDEFGKDQLEQKEKEDKETKQTHKFDATGYCKVCGIHALNNVMYKICAGRPIGTCFVCGKPCENVGEKNKMGVAKTYCCDCYSSSDKKFKKTLWCKICLT